MNREEQRQALGGILESLGRALMELDNAKAEAHRLRDGADGEVPFDEELCRQIEWLFDDADEAADTVEAMLDELQEDEEDEP